MQVNSYAVFSDRVEFNIVGSGLICLATDDKDLISNLIELYDSKISFRGSLKEGQSCLIHPSTVADFVIS